MYYYSKCYFNLNKLYNKKITIIIKIKSNLIYGWLNSEIYIIFYLFVFIKCMLLYCTMDL